MVGEGPLDRRLVKGVFRVVSAVQCPLVWIRSLCVYLRSFCTSVDTSSFISTSPSNAAPGSPFSVESAILVSLFVFGYSNGFEGLKFQ